MKKMMIGIAALAALAAAAAPAVKNGNCSLEFDRSGGVRLISTGGTASTLRSAGTLWRVVFSDGSMLTAAELPPPAIREMDGAVELSWRSPRLELTIRAEPSAADSIDLSARLRPYGCDVEEFFLPDRLEFSPEKLKGFCTNFPVPRNPGMRLNRHFFEDCATLPEPPLHVVKRGNGAYQALLGRTAAPYVRFRGRPEATPAGRELYEPAFLAQLEKEEMAAGRPMSGFNADIKLLRLGDDFLLAGSRLGSRTGGALFRLGGRFVDKKRNGELIRSLICATAAGVVRPQKQKFRVALIAPPAVKVCAETDSRPDEWRAALEEAGFNVRLLLDGRAVLELLRHGENEIVVNPHGSILLLPEHCSDQEFAAAMKEFVQRGNYWFECAGYSFFHRFVPLHYLSSGRQTAPPMLADFIHMEFAGSSFALYSVQRPAAEPFSPAQGYIPAILEFGGAPSGGFLRHGFLFSVRAGAGRQTPAWRIRTGCDPFAALRLFCSDHGLTRTLDRKLPPALLEKMRNSFICKLAPPQLRDVAALPGILPSPMIYHTSRYLNGGPLDKGYPDHLPVRAEWASPGEFGAFLDRIHAAGSLFMPYTNNTWWCDNPRGPTFRRVGEGPLLRQKDGSFRRENYGGGKTGYTVSAWHPEARKAADRIIDGFAGEYQADIVFQDQVGARGARLDFNPVVPFPDAYNEGIVSQARIDARRKPLATEDLWWGVIDSEVMACGMHFGVTPPRRGKRKFLKEIFPESTWTIFPMLHLLASDKLMLTPHNLGYNSASGDLALVWPIALGFSQVVHCNGVPAPGALEQLRWVDRIQKSVCARWVGVPVREFRHEWGSGGEFDHGTIEAQYGAVKVFANVGEHERKYRGISIPPGGFLATAPELVAGITGPAGNRNRFVMDRKRLYCFGRPGSTMEIPGTYRVAVPECENRGGITRIRLPEGPETYARLYRLELQ